MYGMGGMAKIALKNAFVDKTSQNSRTTLSNHNKRPLGHIEKRAASRSILKFSDAPISYVPPRIEQSEKSSNSLKGAEFSGCTFINGSVMNTLLTGCIIDGNKNRLINLDLDFSNLDVSGTAIINQLQVTRVNSNLIPTITQTYDIGTNLLQWNYIYGKYLDASYGVYVGGTTNGFSIERPTDSGNTNLTNTIGNLVVENTNTTGVIINKLGTTDSNTSFQINNSADSTKFIVYGDGQVDIANNLDVSGGIDIDADNQSLTIGASQDLSFNHNGTNSNIVSTTGDLEISNTNTTGDTIVKLGTDNSNTSFIVNNSSGQALMKIDGDERAYFTGKVNVNDTTDATNVTNGALQTDGGLSVVKSAYIGQNLTVSGSINTGCLYSNGGVARGNYYFDGDIYVTGKVITTRTLVKDPVTIPTDLGDCAASEMEMGGGGESGPWTSDDDNIYQIAETKAVLIGSQTLIDVADTTNQLEVTGKTMIDGRLLCANATNATNTTDGSIYTAGGISVVKSGVFGEYVTAQRFIMTSDRRLKKQIKELDNEHDEIDLDEKFSRLTPVKYKWRKQAQTQAQTTGNSKIKDDYNYGLIAQNVLAEFPECAFEKPDGFLGIDYMGLTSVLILKMQKQNIKLKEKDEKIESLENTVKKQEIILNNIIQRMEKLEDINDNESNGSQTSRYGSSWDKYENSIMRTYKDRDRDPNGGSGGGFGSSYGSYGSR